MSEDQNWENGSFDEYIRRSVEDPQLEFDPEAWEAMEEKLDARSGGTRSGGTRSGGTGHAGNAGKIGGGLLVLLLMSLLGWFLFSGSEESTSTAESLDHQQLADPVSANSDISGALPHQEVISEVEESTDQLATSGKSAVEAGNRADASGEKDRFGSSGNNGENREEHPSSATVSVAGGISSSGLPASAVRVRAGSSGTVSDQGTDADNTSMMRNELPGTLAEDKGAKDRVLQKLSWQDFIFDMVEIHPVGQTSQEQPAAGKEQEEKAVPFRQNRLPLSLSLSLSPDFSGAGKEVSARLGAGAGFHLEYNILPRLGLVTGLVYSQKNYLANSSYSPYEFDYYRPEPDYIDASCGVLDIPLNLRYYVLQGKRHSFFLSSGLSSYLMKSEDYTLVYYDERYEDYTYELRNENRHYFAVYNFSAGYEVRWSPRWALQAEPFLKLPSKGLGAGSIRLNSMGAFVHLKYQIGRPGN